MSRPSVATPMAAALAMLLAAGCATGGSSTTASAAPPISTTRVVTGANRSVAVSAIDNPTASVKTMNATPKSVWEAVQAVYTELQIPVTGIDQAKMTIQNSTLHVRRTLAGERMPRWLSCGGPSSMPNAETYQIDGTLSTQVIPGKDGVGADVVTLLTAVATPVAFSGAPVNCSSTMELEKRIYTLVGRKVSG
ncbi:MAG: hypothetical protein ACJ8AO_20095 [Gemmatimonadaceae bacterium]